MRLTETIDNFPILGLSSGPAVCRCPIPFQSPQLTSGARRGYALLAGRKRRTCRLRPMVTEGYQALHGPEVRGGVVHVRAHSRTRDGRFEQVAAHTRAAPPAAGEGAPAATSARPLGQDDGQPSATPAQSLFLLPRPLLLYQRPPILPRIPMRRVPNQSGKEAATDVPSFARGLPRYVGESPSQFARRVMDDHWGAGRWEHVPRRMREMSQIRKHGQRAFEMPAIPGLTDDPDLVY